MKYMKSTIHITKINFAFTTPSINIIKTNIFTTGIHLIITIITRFIIIITTLIKFIFITTIIISISVTNIIIPTFIINIITNIIVIINITITSSVTFIITIFILLCDALSFSDVRFFQIDLMKYFLMFNKISFYSFIEYSTIYINVFLKMTLCVIKLSRIVFCGHFCYCLIFIHTAAAETNYTDKKEINYKKKNTKMTQKPTLLFICITKQINQKIQICLITLLKSQTFFQ